jgi:hypothetical protein
MPIEPGYREWRLNNIDQEQPMTTRIIPACGIVVFVICCAVGGDDTVWIGLNLGDTHVTRASANRIEWMLMQTAACDFNDQPLDEVCNLLEQNYQIPIWIDKQALQDEGINSDTQVTLVKKGITLEVILRLLLEPMAVTHLVEDGVLKITTITKADEKMSTRLYPVADLVTGGTSIDDYEALILLIQENSSGKWHEYDGEGGAISAFLNARSLVVRQTRKVHQEAFGILAAVRKARQVQQLESIPINPGDPDVLFSVDPPSNSRRPRMRDPGNVPAWQRPRIHAAE